ncbi:hypothetical protein COT52_02555, partial [candidate division WWE3 bacterium CG08_land_8_20_14_0_20_43_13]
IAAKLAGGGIGKTSYNQVLGIYRHGLLKKVICDSAKEGHELDTRLVKKIHASFFERLKIIPLKYQYALKDNLYDLMTLPHLQEAEIFHVWNGHGYHCLDKMSKFGALTVVERASSHINTYERLLQEEYKRWGISLNPVLSWAKKRMLEEYQKADFISTPSEFSYQSMIEAGVETKKLVKLPYGVDASYFVPGNSEQKNDHFTVLFAGQVGFRKGVVYLLEAWKKLNLPNAKLVILGEILNEFVDVVEKYKELTSVEFTGFREALPYFQSSHLFVFPSLEEGSALVTYEALACGLPVITTFESGSVVEDGMEGYLVGVRQVDQIADRIRHLYDHVDLRDSMSRAARRKALEYTWEACGDRLVGWYKGLV